MTEKLENLYHFLYVKKMYLFGYFSVILHISAFTYLSIKGLPVIDKEICNLPVMTVLRAEVVPPDSFSGEESENKEKTEGDIPQSKSQAMAKEKSEGKSGDFAASAGVDKEKWGDLLERLEGLDDLKGKFSETLESNNGAQVKESYIKRKRDYESIVSKDVFPTLDTINKPFSEIVKEAPEDLQKYERRNEIIEDFKLWSEGKLTPDVNRAKIKKPDTLADSRQALSFPEPDRKKYFDSTLTKGKEEQLADFLRSYGGYDFNEGDLPKAIRELYYENLQRIAYQFNSDPTYFMLDYFQEALNKEDFLKRSLDLVSKKQRTKVSAELLFAIENIYEIQQRAWEQFFRFRDLYPALPQQKKKEVRVETLRRVAERYTPQALRKGIKDYKSAFDIYSKRRVEIMDFLLRTSPGGYRANDALFQKGQILWDRGDELRDDSLKRQAVQIWQSIPDSAGNGDFLNKEVLAEMKPLLGKFTGSRDQTAMQIQGMLRNRVNKLIMGKIDRENRLLWGGK